MELTYLLLTLLVVGTALAVPSSVRPTESCSERCQKLRNPKFKYTVGQTYTYNYIVDTSSSVVGLSDDEAKTRLSCEVDIEVHSDCDWQLKIRNVAANLPQVDSRQVREYKNKLTANGLMFSFNDGLIKKVCPSSNDPTWVVNIKRGILTALQNNMHTLSGDFSGREVDVAGNCVTDYKTSTGSFWGGNEITKTKKINTCTGRHGNRSLIQSDHYFSPYAGIQNLPLVHSTSECKQTINKQSIISSVVCEEHHHLRVFSNQENGGTTKVVSRLTYSTNKKITSRPSKIVDRRCLRFEHTDEDMPTGSVTDAVNILYKICSNARDEIKPDMPDLFNDLVSVLQKLSESAVQNVYQKLEKKEICSSPVAMSVFMDALPAAGNAGSVATMVKMISDQKVRTTQEMAWYTSLAFNPRPTEETIEALLPFLQASMADVKTDALLSVSSLIHTYCRLDEKCEEKPVMNRVFGALQKLLGYKCRTRSETERKATIGALKSLGNIGRLGSTATTVKQCYEHPSTELPIRLAAIEAYRRTPCTTDETENKINLLKKADEDVEVRISAYISAMRCVAELKRHSYLRQIVEQLKTETVNQVASFMWSHLTNLQETSSPVKQQLKSMLLTYSLKERKPNDFRKFSRNYEWSTMNDKYNIGADLESNVIFTPRSYLPQSFMSNVTANMFGYSVNMFEVGGRMQGLDYYFEKYFSEHNSDSALKDLWKSIPELLKAKAEEIENSVSRGKRSVYSKNRLENIDQQVNEISEVSADGAIYLKIFGNELKVITLEDIKKLQSTGLNLKQILDKMASGLNVNIAKSVIFANHRFSVPTIGGVPIRFAINATSTLGATVSGKFDIRDMILHPRSLDIDASIKPSGALRVSGAMYVDTGVSKHGLKMKSNYHSSVIISGKVFYKNGELKLKLNTPREKAEIFSHDAKVLLVHPGSERPLRMKSTESYSYDKCHESLYRPLGMHFCMQASLPKPFYSTNLPMFPLNGPRTVKIFMKKADRSMRGYEFSFQLFYWKKPNFKPGHEGLLKLDFNTPGSQINRHISLEVNLDNAENAKSYNIKFKSPFASLDVISSAKINELLEKAELNVVYKGSKRYLMDAEINFQKTTENALVYKPNIRFEYPDSTPVTLNGMIGYYFKDQTFHKLEIDMKSSQYNAKPYAIVGMIKKEGDMKQAFEIVSNLSLNTPKFEVNYDASVSKDDDKVIGSDIVMWYKPEGKQKHTLSWNTKVKNLSTQTLVKLNTITGMTSSLYPKYNWQTTWDFQMTKGHFENELVIGYGPNMNWDQQKIRYLEVIQYKLSPEKKLENLDVKVEIKQQSKEIDYSMHTIYNNEMNGKMPHITVNTTVKYGPQKTLKASGDLNVESLKPFKLSSEAIIELPENRFVYREQIAQKTDFTGIDSQLFLRWAPNKSLRHTVEVKLNDPNSSDNVRVTGKITGQGYNFYPVDYELKKRTTDMEIKYDGVVKVRRIPKYTVQLNHGRRTISGDALWDMPYTSGQLSYKRGPKLTAELTVKEPRISIRAEFKKHRNSVNSSFSWDQRGENAKQFAADVNWDRSDDSPFSTPHNARATIQLNRAEIINVEVATNENWATGPHSVDIKVALPEEKQIRFRSGYKMNTVAMDAYLNYYHDNQRLLFSTLKVTSVQGESEIIPDIDVNLKIKSVYEKLKDFEYDMKLKTKQPSSNKFNFDQKTYLKLAPEKEIRVEQNINLRIVRDSDNVLSSADYTGSDTITSTIEGFESRESTFNGNYRSQYEYSMNGVTKLSSGKTIRQSTVVNLQLDDFEIGYSQRSSESEIFDFAISGNSKTPQKFSYDVYFNRNGDEYALNVTKDGTQYMKATDILIKTPYDNYRNIKLTKRSTEISMFDFDLTADWDNSQRAQLMMKEESRTDGTYKLTTKMSSPWFETTNMDFTLFSPRAIFELNVVKGQNNILHSKLVRVMRETSSFTKFLLKINQKKFVDLQVNRARVPNGYQITVTSSGIYSKMTITTKFDFLDNGYKPSVKICINPTNQCLEADATILINKLEGANFDVNVEAKVKTNPHHTMQANFEIKSESQLYSNKLIIYVNKRQNKYFGYDFIFDKPKNNLKVELLSSSRKATLRYDEVRTGQTKTLTLKISGQEQGHDLIVNLEGTHLSGPNYQATYRMQISHPALQKPIVVKHQKRRHSTQTDIEFSADRTRNLMVTTSFGVQGGEGSFVGGNYTAALRIYTPYSKKVDINMKAHVGLMGKQMSYGAMATWQPKNLSQKPKEIFAYVIVKEDAKFECYYRCPGRVIDIHGNYQKALLSNGKAGILLRANAKDNEVRKTLKAEVGSYRDPLYLNMEISDVANPSEGYKMSAYQIDKNTMAVLFERRIGGRNIKDVQVNFHFNSTHIVHTQIEWNPVVIKALIQKTRQNIKTVWNSLTTENEAINEVNEEIRDKIKVVSEAVKTEIVDPMVEHLKTDIEEFKTELTNEWNFFSAMVEQHGKDFSTIIERERAIVKRNVKRAFKPLLEKLEETKNKVSAKWEEMRQSVQEKYPEFYASANRTFSEMSDAISEQYKKMAALYAEAGVSAIIEDMYVRSKLNSTFSNQNFTAEFYQSVCEWYSELAEDIESNWESVKNRTEEIKQKIYESDTYKKLEEYKSYVYDKYGEYKYRWNSYVESVMQQLDEYPELKELHANIKQYFTQVLQSYQDRTPYTFLDYVNLVKMLVPYNPVINFKDGILAFDLALPYTKEAVTQWTASGKKSEGKGYSFWDTYYGLKPHSNPRKWLPPFSASATVIGSQHYMTFDKKEYDFVGTCSYVLVKDFKDENFTVVAHYSSSRRISLTIEINDKHIDIYNDFKVKLQDQDVDLPINVNNVIVSRLSNTVTFTSKKGVTVECDWNHDICSVHMSGWYFGKTAGMFGRYDNEPSTDLRKPNGEPVSEVYKMADSWGVSRKCATLQNLARKTVPVKSSRVYKRCAAHFERSSSPLRPCFSLVNPKQYMKMCSSSSNEQDKLFCSVSAAYVSACKQMEAPIQIPDECVSCNLRREASKILKRGETVKIEPDMRMKSADIVYIIENRECNSAVIHKLMNKPPYILSRELRSQRIYSRVSVVSYGGKAQPEVHTARNDLFYSFRNMVLAMKTLYQMPRVSNDEPSNAFEAIRFASELPFKPAAAKLFILVKCSSCHDNESISYSDTQQLLLQQGIVLSVMTPDMLVVKSGNIGKSKKMFGISAKTVYSQKDVSQKELVGSPNLRTVVAIPKDLCVALAQEVGGAFFTQLPMIKYTSLEKNFDLVMSRQLTATAVPNACQQCYCAATFDGAGKSICSPCSIASPLRTSNIYQTTEDLNMISRRFKSRESKRRRSRT